MSDKDNGCCVDDVKSHTLSGPSRAWVSGANSPCRQRSSWAITGRLQGMWAIHAPGGPPGTGPPPLGRGPITAVPPPVVAVSPAAAAPSVVADAAMAAGSTPSLGSAAERVLR